MHGRHLRLNKQMLSPTGAEEHVWLYLAHLNVLLPTSCTHELAQFLIASLSEMPNTESDRYIVS